MPNKKREITIRFVTASHGSKISSMIDAISDLTDDITVSCRTLGRPTERKAGQVRPTATNTLPHLVDSEGEARSGSQLAYAADNGATHRRFIDVEASLKKLNLTKDQLMSRRWPRGSAQHRLKRAAAVNTAKVGNGAAAH